MTLAEVMPRISIPNRSNREQSLAEDRVQGFEVPHEYDVSFGPDLSEPVYRHTYDAELCDFDPKRIEFRRSSSGPELVLWTRFMRNVVGYETWHRDKGRIKSEQKDSLWIPLKGALSTDQKRELKELASSFMSGRGASGASRQDLKRRLDELNQAIGELTNGLDFTNQGGKGVLEQRIELSRDRTSLIFRQLRKADVDSDGTNLSAKIPLWTMKEEVYACRDREDSGEGLPRVGFHARDHRKSFKFEFSGPPAFTHKNTAEDIYCQTGDDCDRLKELLEEAIVTAKDLAYIKSSEQGGGGQAATRAESK